MRRWPNARPAIAGMTLLALSAQSRPGAAQPIDLAHGGPIAITAADGIEWHQAAQQVIARGDAKAVRGEVTVTADRLTAWYRKKPGADGVPSPRGVTQAAAQSADVDTEGNEVYRLQAEGRVHIFTPTDQAWGDLATYDIDQAVLVLTGRNIRLTTPNDVVTARDDVEYWSQKHMAVARGNAVVVTDDGRRLAADTLVAYTSEAPSPPAAAPVAARPPGASGGDPLLASGRLEKVEAFGNVSVRTTVDTVTGDRAVYVPDSGIARVGGRVRITRGQNQLAGSEAEVNLKTNVSRLLAGNTGRVQGLVVPNDSTNQQLVGPAPATAPGTGARQ